jgi:hypothetical protein
MPDPLVVIPTSDDIDKVRGYKMGKWHAFNNYECIYCQYSTLWRAKMEKHQLEGEHAWPFPGQNPRSTEGEADPDTDAKY